jgi:cephalosporin hydroxylase
MNFDLTQAPYPTLKRLIAKYDVRSVIEIGSYLGASAACFAEHERVEHVFCIDPFRIVESDAWWAADLERCGIPPNFFHIFEQNLKDRGLWEKVTACVGLSSEWADRVPPVDMVYVDGEHSYENCKSDIRLYAPKARKILVGDDYSGNYPGVIRAVTELVPGAETEGVTWWKEIRG